jgi:hypothetical protein
VTAYPAWTPASRPGIIPLHPLTFGTVLGRSFAGLRHNPRVLLGFAVVVQSVAYLVVLVAAGAISFAAFSRLDTVSAYSDDYQTIYAGSIAILVVSVFVLAVLASALGVIVQAVVVTDVAHAVLAEKPRLGALWRQVRPVAWRLIGYSFLVGLVLVVAFGAVGLGVFAVGLAVPALAIVLGILVVLAAIPLLVWLATKLVLVPSIILLEGATIRRAIPRSWHLTGGRFWATWGVLVIIQLLFGAIAQLVTIPFTLIGATVSGIVTPTGDPATASILTSVITLGGAQIISLLVQSVGSVVSATATALLYVDARMRHEALDLDLLSYVERRDAGATDLPDPYRAGIGRTPPPRPAPWPGYAPAPGAASAPGYPPAPWYAPAPGYPPAPGYDQPPADPVAPGYPPAATSPQPETATSPAPGGQPSPTEWAAPGSSASDDRA